MITSFTDLRVWQEGHGLVLSIHDACSRFPKEELYGLTSPLKRASASITSNIAEGFGRSSIADKLHFYIMARGSLTELQNQIILTGDVGLITAENIKIALEQAEITHKLVVGLIKVTERRKQ